MNLSKHRTYTPFEEARQDFFKPDRKNLFVGESWGFRDIPPASRDCVKPQSDENHPQITQITQISLTNGGAVHRLKHFLRTA